MVAPGAGLRGVTLFGPKIGEDKKKVFAVRLVSLRFRIIIWCHPGRVAPP